MKKNEIIIKIELAKRKLKELNERISMLSEDKLINEIILKDLIKQKDQFEHYKTLINLNEVDWSEQNPCILIFDNFPHLLKKVNYEKISDLIIMNLKISTDKNLVFNILKDVMIKASIHDQEEYFCEISRKFIQCLFNKLSEKRGNNTSIDKKYIFKNVSLLIKLCFNIENLNLQIDEKLSYLTEEFNILYKENYRRKTALENEIKELVFKYEVKSPDIKRLSGKPKDKLINSDRLKEEMINKDNIKKLKSDYLSSAEKLVLKEASNRNKELSIDKKKICEEINEKSKIPYNFHSDFKENVLNSLNEEWLNSKEITRTNEFGIFSTSEKSVICNLSQLNNTSCLKSNLSTDQSSINRNIFLKKDNTSITSYKAKLNPNPINRNTVDIANNNQKIKSLTRNNSVITKEAKFNVKIDIDELTLEDSILLEKVKPLLEGVDVFKRINLTNNTQTNLKIYNPFDHEQDNPISYGFAKNFVFVNKDFKTLLFSDYCAGAKKTELNITSIDRIEVSQEMKEIVNIIQVSNKNKDKDSSSILHLLKTTSNVNKQFLSTEKISQCLKIEHFLLFLVMTNGYKIELIFKGYNNYKNWLNGLNCLLNNMDMLIKHGISIQQNRKFLL